MECNDPRFSKSLILAILLSCSLSGFSQVTITASSGTGSGSFTTLKEAFDAINAGTHQGAIVININASTTETASAVLNASGSGAASYTGISIYPTTTGLSIAGDLAAPLIDLDGADNVTIDGRVDATGSTKSLTIINTSALSTACTSTIRFINDAGNNTLKYCTLRGSSTDAAAGIVFFSTTTGTTGNDNNTIDNNNITNAANANRPINAVYALGTVGNNNETNTISNNNFYNFLRTGTASNGINIRSNNSAFTISGNSFYETASFAATASVAYNVILISAASGEGNGFTVSGNYIGGRLAQCGGSAWTKTGFNNAFNAISVTTATGTASEIQGNTIRSIKWTNTGAANFTGISLSGVTVANIGTTTGNIVGSIYDTANAANANFYGINISTSGEVDCRNNTISSIITAATYFNHNNNFYGIFKSSSDGTTTISGNTIGSTTTSNSIIATSLSSSNPQLVYGILSSGTGMVTISGNTVANLNNATRNRGTAVSGLVNGISVSAGTNTISNNTVRNLTINNANSSITHTASVSGIVMTSTMAAAQTVNGNTVSNLSNSYNDDPFSGGVIGIYYAGPTTASTVSQNFIHSLSVTGALSTTADICGIKIKSGATTYSNNIIRLGGNTKTDIFGFFETGTLNHNNSLYFNTVYIFGSLASGVTNKSYALYSDVNTNTRDFRNNVLVNARSTVAGSSLHYALFAVSGGSTLTCDHNQYYVSGIGGVPGYYGADMASLPIVTGQDANSTATNPVFFSTGTAASGFAPTVPGTGVTTTGITTDYAGNTRGTPASMGALQVTSWSGGASTDWAATSNWTSGAIPDAGSIVIIPSGLTNYPAVPSDRTLTSLSLTSGASLNLGSNTLTLTSNLSNVGSISGAGKLTMGGTTAQTISGTGTVSNLEVNNSAGVTITSGTGNMQTITGKLTPTSGTLTTNGNLTLRSSATGTARVGEGSASGGYLSGDVITQRYLSKLTGTGRNGRAWRLVTIPVTGTGKLSDVFMAGQPGADLTVPANRSAQPNDLGTVVIGHNQPDAATANGLGYDWIGTAGQVSSLRYYQQNATSGSFASSQVPTLTTTYTAANQGYMLFARGDRQQTYQGTGNSSATVLQATGALKQGTINVTIPALASAGFVLVGNPYMAVLDLEKVILDNATVIDNTVYIWDANIDGNAFRQGGYRAVTRTGASNWIASGAGANPQYIESGSAFFVKPTATGGTLSIKESHKVDGTPGIAPHSSMTEGPSRLFINLEVTDTANRRLVDGAVAFFDNNYKDGLGDPVDIAPMTNLTAGSITLRQSGVRLSMEGRPWPADSAARTLPVDMRNLGDDDYVLRILPTNMNKEGFTARLKDRHLNQETSLKTDDETLYPFRRTGYPGIDSSRFEIVYRLSKPTNAGTLTPDDAAGEMAPRLYPNPARGADVKLSLGSLAPGRYDVQVLDISGRLVLKKTVDHQSSNVVHSIFGKVKPASGLYTIIVTEPKNQIKETLRLVVE